MDAATRLYHLVVRDEWLEALRAGTYHRSTVGVSLAEQGFIHCSFANQVETIANLLFRGRRDIVLLQIDREALTAEVKVENLNGGSELFPHIYGPLPIAAVARWDDVPVGGEGQLLVDQLLQAAGPGPDGTT